MTVTVKDTGKGELPSPCNDGVVEDLAAGEVGVQVDVGGEDEVLVVIGGRLAEGDQVGGGGDLVGVVRLTRCPRCIGLGRRKR